MYTGTNTKLWQYRRKKRRVLGPVARGLIVGGLFMGWIVYCSIFNQGLDFDDSENKLAPELNNFHADEDISNLRNTFESDSLLAKRYDMKDHFNNLHGSSKY